MERQPDEGLGNHHAKITIIAFARDFVRPTGQRSYNSRQAVVVEDSCGRPEQQCTGHEPVPRAIGGVLQGNRRRDLVPRNYRGLLVCGGVIRFGRSLWAPIPIKVK